MPIPQLKKGINESWRSPGSTKKPRQLKNGHKKRWLRGFILAGFGVGALFMLTFSIYVAWISRDLPNPNQLMGREIAQSTKIYDRTGEHVLYEISGDEKRTLVSINEIPDHVKQATISIEDKNFYKHGGFSVWAMFRTVVTNIVFNRTAGGSTLTQQFIKNAILTPEKTLPRKIKELVLAYRLEKKFSKDEILQMYLNEIPYGSNAYGVETASQKYFGKSVKDVSLAESAILAAIVQTPSRYSPWGPNKDLLLSRKDYVLGLMAEQGYISQEEAVIAKEEVVDFRGPETNITAPHFVMFIKDILAEKYGEKMVEQDGLKIYTTLDLYKQKIAEEVITEITKDYPEKYKATNASLVSIDPKTGQILAMVGSRDYFNDEIDGQVNVSTRPRQPGSSLKPLVYATLFEKGYTPDTILYDVLTNFSTDTNKPYQPKNYNGTENGPVSIRKSLAGSLNIPAVKAIYLSGINNVIDTAENLGYTTFTDRSRFGLSLVLGGGEVKLLEHTNAYSAFARDGEISPITGILKVEDKDGRVIEEFSSSSKKVLDSQVARMINSILSDNTARAFVFGLNNPLTLGGRPVAAKTGTTNDYRDAWTIGYTPSLVTGVWVGNNNNQEMKAAGGSIGAAPIWQEYMKRVLGDTPVEEFKAPNDYKTGKSVLDGVITEETILVDISTGQPASENTPPELVGEVKRTAHHNILHYVNPEDPRGAQPENPATDPQYELWEKAVRSWAEKNSTSTKPILINNDNSTGAPTIIISLPFKNQTITTPQLEVLVEGSGPQGISQIEYYLNNNLWETRLGEPQLFTKNINHLSNGYHALKARACDNSNLCSENTIYFNLLIPNNPVGSESSSVSIISPKNGLTTNGFDWPLPVKLIINNHTKVSSLSLLIKDNNRNITTIETPNPPSKEMDIIWDNPPPPGNYEFYVELLEWGGNKINSPSLFITVN